MQQIALAWIQELLLQAPFIAPLGLNIVDVSHDRAHVRLPLREEVSGIGNHLHSGAMAALIEFAGTVAAVSGIGNNDDAAGCITSQLTVTYLSPVSGMHVDAIATVAHRAQRQAVIDIFVLCDKGTMIAKATAICRIFEQPALERAA